MEILSFWVKKNNFLKAQYCVQEQEDTFKLDQNCTPCFLLKYKWEPFDFPGSYLLSSKEGAVFFNHNHYIFKNAISLLT